MGTVVRARSPSEEGEAVLLRACPRCGGDLHRTRDIYGPYRECLQCGFLQEEPEDSSS